jgi:hypothetical protein
VAGIQSGFDQRFTCDVVDDDTFRLVGDRVPFDFDDDGVFEDAGFEAEFDEI